MACLIFAAGFKNLANTAALNYGKWKMAKDTGSLRIMTWNVEDFISLHNQKTPEAQTRVQMLKAIQAYNPDILCLQEYVDVFSDEHVNMSSKKELDSLGYIYSYVSNDTIIKTWFPALVFRGSAVYSKIPLADSGRITITPSGKQENIVYNDIIFRGKPLRVITGHLLSFALYTDTTNGEGNILKATFRRKRRIEYKIRETEIEHEKEVAIICKTIGASPYPVIYCGDINSTPASYTYNTLRGGLMDAFLEKGAGLGGTFYKLGPTLRIDVCLADKRLKVLQCTVPQLYLSDHFPVVTDIKWK